MGAGTDGQAQHMVLFLLPGWQGRHRDLGVRFCPDLHLSQSLFYARRMPSVWRLLVLPAVCCNGTGPCASAAGRRVAGRIARSWRWWKGVCLSLGLF